MAQFTEEQNGSKGKELHVVHDDGDDYDDDLNNWLERLKKATTRIYSTSYNEW
jgi:hypothetical protein